MNKYVPKQVFTRFFGRVNFTLLKAQKRVLLDIQEKTSSQAHNDSIEGILNMIDGIQDIAVKMGFDEKLVFNLTNDEDVLELTLEECEKIVLKENQ